MNGNSYSLFVSLLQCSSPIYVRPVFFFFFFLKKSLLQLMGSLLNLTLSPEVYSFFEMYGKVRYFLAMKTESLLMRQTSVCNFVATRKVCKHLESLPRFVVNLRCNSKNQSWFPCPASFRHAKARS